MLEWASTAAAAWSGNVRPIAHYIAGAVLEARGDTARAAEERERARAADLTRAFPFGLDALDALEAALAADPDDAVAHSLIGMLLYAHGRRLEAARALGAGDRARTRRPRAPPQRRARRLQHRSRRRAGLGAVRARRSRPRPTTPASDTSRTSSRSGSDSPRRSVCSGSGRSRPSCSLAMTSRSST